jgi:uncharacterized protein YdcH (DUF465 family)
MHKAGSGKGECHRHGHGGQASPAHGAGKAEGGCPMQKGPGAASGAGMHGKGHGPAMQGRGQGMRGNGMRGNGMQGRGPGGDHATIHSLMSDHDAIARKTEEVPGGVRTVTTSAKADVAATIRKHAYEMKARLESGQPIRMFDPLFVEIFKNHDKIEMKIEEIEGGVRVTETSTDPKVTALIRQHAKVVDEFTARGMERMHQTSPLPEGYPTP